MYRLHAMKSRQNYAMREIEQKVGWVDSPINRMIIDYKERCMNIVHR